MMEDEFIPIDNIEKNSPPEVKEEDLKVIVSQSSKDILNQIIKSNNVEELKDLTQSFNINQMKKEMIRAEELNNLQDTILKQAKERIENRGHEMSNKDLLDYYNTIQNGLDKTKQYADSINQQPLIQITNNKQEININNEIKGKDIDFKKIDELLSKLLVSDNSKVIDTTIESKEEK